MQRLLPLPHSGVKSKLLSGSLSSGNGSSEAGTFNIVLDSGRDDSSDSSETTEQVEAEGEGAGEFEDGARVMAADARVCTTWRGSVHNAEVKRGQNGKEGA